MTDDSVGRVITNPRDILRVTDDVPKRDALEQALASCRCLTQIRRGPRLFHKP